MSLYEKARGPDPANNRGDLNPKIGGRKAIEIIHLLSVLLVTMWDVPQIFQL